MKKAIMKETFSVVQWHGEDYMDYEDDAEEGTFEIGDEVLVLHEANDNEIGKLFVIFNPRINESSVVHEDLFEVVEEK